MLSLPNIRSYFSTMHAKTGDIQGRFSVFPNNLPPPQMVRSAYEPVDPNGFDWQIVRRGLKILSDFDATTAATNTMTTTNHPVAAQFVGIGQINQAVRDRVKGALNLLYEVQAPEVTDRFQALKPGISRIVQSYDDVLTMSEPLVTERFVTGSAPDAHLQALGRFASDLKRLADWAGHRSGPLSNKALELTVNSALRSKLQPFGPNTEELFTAATKVVSEATASEPRDYAWELAAKAAAIETAVKLSQGDQDFVAPLDPVWSSAMAVDDTGAAAAAVWMAA